jgi:tetratricopeptide (TPR) repeat protein
MHRVTEVIQMSTEFEREGPKRPQLCHTRVRGWQIPLLVLALGCANFGGNLRALEAGMAQFDALSHKLESAPQDALAGDALRKVCREQKIVRRCIDFLDQLAEKHPTVDALVFNAALAYVDELPNHTLLVQGRLSLHSIEHVSGILVREPDNWIALYIRGLNNLYWPIWYRRSDRAIADLTRCTQLSRNLAPERRQPYMALSYVALGDTYVRLDRIDEALAVWKEGLSMYPSKELRERIGTARPQLHDMIESIRSRDVPIDTSLEAFSAAIRGSTS